MEAEKRESGVRTKNKTTALQYTLCVQCVWSNMSINNRPLQPPTHSSSINLLIIILDDSDHHTRSRGIAREREREREGGRRGEGGGETGGREGEGE